MMLRVVVNPVFLARFPKSHGVHVAAWTLCGLSQ